MMSPWQLDNETCECECACAWHAYPLIWTEHMSIKKNFFLENLPNKLLKPSFHGYKKYINCHHDHITAFLNKEEKIGMKGRDLKFQCKKFCVCDD